MASFYRTFAPGAVFPRHVRHPILLALAILLALPGGAAAAPALVTPLKPCYVSLDEENREAVTVDSTGWAPAAGVQTLLDGTVAGAPGFADPLGTLRGTVPAPYVAAGQRAFTLQLVDTADPAVSITATARVAALDVTVRPARARPSARVRFRGTGFTASGPIYAHYVHRASVRRTVRLARPHGACGSFSARARQIPVAHPGTGQWTVLLDQQRRYTETPTGARARLVITVRRVPRSS